MRPSDEELRDALRHEGAPAGFAERVLAHARQIDHQHDWRWPVTAAAVVAIAAGSAVYVGQVRRVEGTRAKEEVLLALRVTGEKLRSARVQVQETQQRRLDLPEQ